jgi:hypothetical protein
MVFVIHLVPLSPLLGAHILHPLWIGKINWFVVQQMLVFLVVVIIVQLIQTMDSLICWFFLVPHLLSSCEIDSSLTLILNKFVCRFLIRVRNPCIDYKDCAPILVGFNSSMKVFYKD